MDPSSKVGRSVAVYQPCVYGKPQHLLVTRHTYIHCDKTGGQRDTKKNRHKAVQRSRKKNASRQAVRLFLFRRLPRQRCPALHNMLFERRQVALYLAATVALQGLLQVLMGNITVNVHAPVCLQLLQHVACLFGDVNTNHTSNTNHS